jgi:two-component system, OmpR family, alkaline phosphatase synthesis response regulator PhoP
MAKKVLIIEDSKMSRDMLKMNLESAGIQATSVNDAKQALEILAKESFNLIILDLILPGLDGFGLLTMIKDMPLAKNVPVIILSGRDSKEEKEEAKRLGAVYYMVKHLVHPSDVLKTIQTFLRE